MAAQFSVQAIPTIVLLKDNSVLKRMVGLQQASTLMGALEAAGA